MISQVIEGSYFTARDCDQVDFNQDALICIDSEGIISRIVNHDDPKFGEVRR